MNRYFIRLAFDGTPYHGWQIQPNAITVQQVLNDALTMMLREPVNLTGCGRTDTGVHAEMFYAHMDLKQDLSPDASQKLVHQLNSYLDDTIAVSSVFPVLSQMHARFSARARTYRYRILRKKNPFLSRFSYTCFTPLDLELMNRGADFLISVNDFTSYSKVNSDVKSHICQVTKAQWRKENDQLIFEIRADRFLRNMVRAIVGTLMELGQEKISFDQLRQITASRNRSDAGESVPASGLALVEVEYPEITSPW